MKTKRALRSKPDHAYKCHRHPPVPSQEWSEEIWGEHTQCHLQSPGSDPFSAPTDAAELFCAVKGPPGPTMMSPMISPPWCPLLAKRSSDQSLPLLVCHTRYPTTMMMMRSVWCGGENERRGGRHRNEYCWMRRHDAKMSKQNENKKWNHDASPPSLEKETLQSSATWRKSLSSGDFLRFFCWGQFV